MTIYIIGGGVGGLAVGISLRKAFPMQNIIIMERRSGMQPKQPVGHGMILLPNAIKALDVLGARQITIESSRPINRTVVTDGDGHTLVEEVLQEENEIYCCSREALIRGLENTLLFKQKKVSISYDKQCISVETKDNRVVKLLLDDGTFYEVSKNDLVVGSDGYRSILCQAMNSGTLQRPKSQVFELVTSTVAPQLAAKLSGTFHKILLSSKGLAFGLLSPSYEKVIGFIQFDTKRYPIPRTKQDIKDFFQMVLSQTRTERHELFLEYSNIFDADSAHVWRPINSDLPDVLHMKNAVLIGDAAHPLLPFTSQGTAAALEDAISLSNHLVKFSNKLQTTDVALIKFIRARQVEVNNIIHAGRRMLRDFIDGSSEYAELPYVKDITRGCSSNNTSSEEVVERAVFDDSQIDLDQLQRKAYNYRWATVPDNVIPLTAADSDFPVAKPIREAMAKYIDEGYMNYTPPMGLPSLREAIANHRQLQSMNQVFVTDSAASAMFLVAQYCIRHPGDEVLCPDPVDFLFQRSIEQAGGKVVRYALSAPSQSKGALWKFDADVISSLITHRTKMIAICNPHNPVGRVWTVAEIRQLCDIAKRNHLLLWSDEVWADITYKPFTPTAEIARQYDIDTFTVIGFSKGYGLAGLRIGAILCPTPVDAEAISKLSLANDTAYGTASVSQVAAQAALERCSHWLRAFRAHVESQCLYAVQRLNQIPHVYCTMPEGTFVCFANVSHYLEKKGIDEATLVEYLLNHAKVAVVPGSPQFFGHNAAGHIRISVATSRQLLEKALDRLEKGLLNLENVV